MKFTKRDIEMIEYLKDYESIDLEAMSDYLDLSVKTLKNQLKNLSEELKEYGITIRFMPGNQIMIKGHERFADVMSEGIPRFEMGFEKRCLLLLVLHDDFLIIQDIADALLVSKSYAEKHLAELLKKYPEDIQSQRHYGIRFSASQNRRRELFVNILFPYIFGEDYSVALRQFHQLHFPILNYFTDDQLERAEEVVNCFRNLEWFRLTDESMQQIYLYVLFLARQADIGNSHNPVNESSNVTDIDEFDGLYEWLSELCKKYKLPDSEGELRYTYNLLLSLRKQKITCNDQILKKMKEPVGEILRGIRKRLGVDLSQDQELAEGLSTHIYTTVLRGDHMSLETDGYMIKSMKRQYPFGFEMAAIAADYISDIYDLSMTENEVTYLAIHFQAAIERRKDEGIQTKIMIVCHFGSAAARILRSKIERRINDVKITGMYSLQEFSQLKNPDCDCIVTTEKVHKPDRPVIYVSMALPEREMNKIRECIREIQISHLLEISILEAIILPIEDEDMESAICSMIRPLEEEEFVTPEYCQSVLDREKTSSTSFSHIALPHGNPAFVQNTRLVIGRMKKPFMWDDSKVCCAFMFAVSPEVLKEKPMLFQTFYRILGDPEVEDQIKKLQTGSNVPDEVFRQKLFHIMR